MILIYLFKGDYVRKLSILFIIYIPISLSLQMLIKGSRRKEKQGGFSQRKKAKSTANLAVNLPHPIVKKKNNNSKGIASERMIESLRSKASTI